MTRQPTACFLLFVAGLMSLLFLGVASLREPQPVAGRVSNVWKNPRVQAQPPSNGWKNAYGNFQRLEKPETLALIYIWTGYRGTEQTFQIDISKAACTRAVQANGITPTQRSTFFAVAPQPSTDAWREVQDALRKERGPVHLAEYAVLPSNVRKEFFQWLEKTETAFLASRNFERVRKGRLTIDYSGFVRSHMQSVKPIADAMLQMGVDEKMTWFWLKHRLMSLIHNLEYELPPTMENGCYINGIWAPLDAFCRGRGDCDTKAVLFSAVVNHLNETKCAIVVIPGHAFNGLVGWHKRLPGDTVIKHRGVDMMLLDLTDHSTYSTMGRIHNADQQSLREQKPEVYETW